MEQAALLQADRLTHHLALQVLNVINFAEADLLADNPAMANAHVMVHLLSHVKVDFCTVHCLHCKMVVDCIARPCYISLPFVQMYAACCIGMHQTGLHMCAACCFWGTAIHRLAFLAYDWHVVTRRHTMLQCYGGACQTAAAGSRPRSGAELEVQLPPSPHWPLASVA